MADGERPCGFCHDVLVHDAVVLCQPDAGDMAAWCNESARPFQHIDIGIQLAGHRVQGRHVDKAQIAGLGRFDELQDARHIAVEFGSAEQIIDAPKDPYTKALMAAAFEMKADETGIVSS